MARNPEQHRQIESAESSESKPLDLDAKIANLSPEERKVFEEKLGSAKEEEKEMRETMKQYIENALDVVAPPDIFSPRERTKLHDIFTDFMDEIVRIVSSYIEESVLIRVSSASDEERNQRAESMMKKVNEEFAHTINIKLDEYRADPEYRALSEKMDAYWNDGKGDRLLDIMSDLIQKKTPDDDAQEKSIHSEENVSENNEYADRSSVQGSIEDYKKATRAGDPYAKEIFHARLMMQGVDLLNSDLSDPPRIEKMKMVEGEPWAQTLYRIVGFIRLAYLVVKKNSDEEIAAGNNNEK